MKTVLAVDDRIDDLLLLEHACRRTQLNFQLQTANDGQKAIDQLTSLVRDASQTVPDLLLLDLKMARKTGLEVLGWVRQQPRLVHVKVAVFSSSQNERDVARAYDAGADWYFVKPVDYVDLVKIASAIDQFLNRGDVSLLVTNPFYRSRK